MPRLAFLAVVGCMLIASTHAYVQADTSINDWRNIPDCNQTDFIKLTNYALHNARKLQCDSDIKPKGVVETFHVTDSKVLCDFPSCIQALRVAVASLPNCNATNYPFKAMARSFLLTCGEVPPTSLSGSLAQDAVNLPANATTATTAPVNKTWAPASASGSGGSVVVPSTTPPPTTATPAPTKSAARSSFHVAGAAVAVGATLAASVW